MNLDPKTRAKIKVLQDHFKNVELLIIEEMLLNNFDFDTALDYVWSDCSEENQYIESDLKARL